MFEFQTVFNNQVCTVFVPVMGINHLLWCPANNAFIAVMNTGIHYIIHEERNAFMGRYLAARQESIGL